VARAAEFIEPFPLESPEVIPPPKELSKLHFNSLYLKLIESNEFVAMQKRRKGKGTAARKTKKRSTRHRGKSSRQAP
jgi:hypothetical protein